MSKVAQFNQQILKIYYGLGSVEGTKQLGDMILAFKELILWLVKQAWNN